ncbi:hypothetical protein B296_00027496 [Ensete ventricosum]|uniref:Uncharacterized protein n=1 Tax=Ensete ventricosum TaxID=4639 RepID=A0A426YC46_ENSVE|nr:hypothetical protein B296_00027496 [Ensete ventricosum]
MGGVTQWGPSDAKVRENPELHSREGEVKSSRERERERESFFPLYLLPKRVFYTCGRGDCQYTQPYPCRPSGYGRIVRRTCGYSSMGRGRGASYYINGRGARQCRTRSSPLRIPDRRPTWSLGLTWLPPKCCCSCPSGVGLDESDRPIRYPIMNIGV